MVAANNLLKLSLPIGDLFMDRLGGRRKAAGANGIEADAAVYMKEEKKIDIDIELNLGKKNFTAYTMDLTKKYIEINGDYRS